jgi:myo-inositol 2-dehydrogenase / D-chiro-inositol 1-dehydrogenase
MARTRSVSRREFIAGTLAATAAGPLLASPATARAQVAAPPSRKVKLGVVGLGGRGHWIAGLFRQHGGYDLHAVADYFPHVAEEQGAALGVDPARRFSGLSGYKRLIESGIEAIALEDLPYFFPEQARASVEAGLHVYMAKPVASDVPGALSIRESAKVATARQRVFLVDYQMPTDPHNADVIRGIREGGVGRVETVFSAGAVGGKAFDDPPFTANLESRLQDLIWVNDDALGCGYIGNYDIHVLDIVLRALGRVPVAAYGWGAKYRPEPHGDALDSICTMFTFDDGTVWNHQSPKGNCELWFSANGSLATEIQGSDASARLSYWGKAYIRGGPHHMPGGEVENLYEAGAVRNIATFHESVTNGRTENDTVQPAVDSALVSILGREAAARRATVTMADILKENRRLEMSLDGLRA